jgi:hypothetical protein
MWELILCAELTIYNCSYRTQITYPTEQSCYRAWNLGVEPVPEKSYGICSLSSQGLRWSRGLVLQVSLNDRCSDTTEGTEIRNLSFCVHTIPVEAASAEDQCYTAAFVGTLRWYRGRCAGCLQQPFYCPTARHHARLVEQRQSATPA